jgi:hypothetical protein
MTGNGEQCRVYDVGGEPVRVRGREPLDEAGQAALGEIVRAAGDRIEHLDPNLGVRQELVQAGLSAMRCIPDGQIPSRFGTSDGTRVKNRLKAAIVAARDALAPAESDDLPPEAWCEHPRCVDHLHLDGLHLDEDGRHFRV